MSDSPHRLDAVEQSFYDTLPPSAHPVIRGVMQRVRMVVDDGYCPTCNGSCIEGFGNPALVAAPERQQGEMDE